MDFYNREQEIAQHAEQNQYTREDYEGYFHLHRASGIQSSENFSVARDTADANIDVQISGL